ncbi:SRPBCC family protein [Niabella drilacis]|uniref:Activator of Hsp90 ATPase homolog 1-like protein n=1 Tax=Niabella drilacis (strain DSM 25811 / CCM 8410 / CCUG 62505 / LMG 26954 / E90) TaxID=1285928 RepID=A0A1G6M2T9_NIADE|nr:SRPBCC domain-containing protein [Niabella drilacis]SDC49799.1 Activator of Hsp90 ATPase homolog 1-like protein [Niabella drilacis]
MNTPDFSVAIITDQAPEVVFRAVNNVAGWWTENIEGQTLQQGDAFEVRFGDVHYSRQQVTEMIPYKKVVWLITDSRLNFVQDPAEWTNTRIDFEILEEKGQTKLRFTHKGLHPAVECYSACSSVWTDYITNSLRNLITGGKGNPASREEPLPQPRS